MPRARSKGLLAQRETERQLDIVHVGEVVAIEDVSHRIESVDEGGHRSVCRCAWP
jgi:hypothetical protein